MSRSSFTGCLARFMVVALLALAAGPGTARAAERTVVLEHWTNFR